MTVAFADLARGVAAQRTEIDAALARVVASGRFVLGTEGRAFEAEFATWLGARETVGVANGTDAIELALRALGVGPGDEVVTQANTCVPTAAAIARTGAEPVLCDVHPDSATLDVDSMARAIGPRTRALVPVHLYGQCSDVPLELGLPVVEDCAQAHGATLHGRTAGTIGALGAFSFYPTKNLAALGDGGAVATDDPELAERLRRLRFYREADGVRGVNSRLDELQAAVLRARLERLDVATARRRAIAAHYDAALADGPVRPLARPAGREPVFHLYVVRTRDRDALRARLEDAGVGTLVHYDAPVHGHPAYRDAARFALPAAEALAREVLSLPLYPELTDAEVEAVAEAVRAHG